MEKIDERKGVIAQLSPVQSTLMMIALLSATLGMCGESVITPGADQMFKYYNDDAFVNFLLSGPNLISMFASILAGIMQKYVDKKKVLLLGMALYCIGGFFGTAFENEVYMMFMRCLVGVALGFTNVTAMSIVTSMYTDDNRRSRMVGIINAGMFTSGVIVTALGGWVCETYGFKAMFNIYAIGLLSVILIAAFIPKIPADKNIAEEEESQGPDSGIVGWKGKMAFLCVGYFLFQVSYAIIPFFISVYVDETGMGGPAFAGRLSSVLFIGAFIASVCFGFVYPKLKRYAMSLSMLLLIIAYIIIIAVQSTIPVTIACLLFGYANANAFSQAVMRAGILAPAKNASLAVSIVAAVMGFGFFAATYSVQILKSLMDVETLIPILPVILTVNIILVITSVVFISRSNKKERPVGEETA